MGRSDLPAGSLFKRGKTMITKKKLFSVIAILFTAALIFAPKVFSVYWDGFFTNLLVKGLFQPQGKAIVPVTALSGTSPAGYSIANTDNGILFTVDPTTYPGSTAAEKVNDGTDECPIGLAWAGVTVTVSPSTAATGDRVIGIQNVGGSTAFVVQIEGALPIQTASGTTVPGVYDAQGDIVWLRLPTGGAVSAYMIDRIIQ